ncbi:uncharacterized protein KY384_008635 [Bacidia gigantensis]|uniref:uncharacterized protein n=1 Tax=Bacidia gigantensis TaxID=2732470 RepID=UPI001D05ADA8|nr:uncharacterized protein KY384_008635 [Bacidia gigantensis]KAG8527205.1 hypothetical protein KY384_008635 [Bacidia gigantensis]
MGSPDLNLRPALLATCKTIYAEAIHSLYLDKTFSFKLDKFRTMSYLNADQFFTHAPCRLDLIKNVELHDCVGHEFNQQVSSLIKMLIKRDLRWDTLGFRYVDFFRKCKAVLKEKLEGALREGLVKEVRVYLPRVDKGFLRSIMQRDRDRQKLDAKVVGGGVLERVLSYVGNVIDS